MRYSSLLALCAFMLCLNVPEVRGEILAVHTYDVMTHTALLPKPVASDNTFSLAATWWLPDWQSSQKSRGSDDIGGGDIDGECETYGYVSECNAPKISGGIIYPISGLACHKSCSCSGNFQYTSSNCSGKYKLSGSFCDGKYSACVCKDEFRYDSSNCNGENKLGGEICNGKYNSCTLRPECTVSSKDCTYGCAEYNSCNRCTSCKSNPDCDVSDKSCTYGCASYNSCSKCTSCKSNPDCSATAVSCDYGCASTNSCGICTSCSGNPDCNVSDKSCDCGCSSTNSCGKCTSCKSCPPEDPCSGVSCGANAYCSGGSCYCNSGYTGNANSGCTEVDTCTYTTTASSCSSQCKNIGSSSCTKNGITYYNGCGSSKCSSGQTCSNGTCVTSCVSGGSSSCSGQTSSCSSSQVQTASCKDCSGTTHYTCRAKTCAEQGKKDCNGSCISTSECCGGCPSGYSCKNGICKEKCSAITCPTAVFCPPARGCEIYSTPTNCCPNSVCTHCKPTSNENEKCQPSPKQWCFANGFAYIECSYGQSVILCLCDKSYKKCVD